MPPLTLPGARWNPESNLVLLERRIITPDGFRVGAIASTDPALIRHLYEHPDEVFSLSHRQFEELIAHLLHREGYVVRLGPRGSDGGVDVLAERKGEFGPELTLVQCKQNRGANRVGEPLVKQLYGDVTLRNATRGLLVTTSSFTGPALRFIDDAKYRLAGRDFAQLKNWLKRLRRRHKTDLRSS